MLLKEIRLFATKKPRGFNYKPRHQKQENEDEVRRNIHFGKMTSLKSSNKRSFIYLIILAIVVVYLLIYFTKLTEQSDQHFKIENFQVEEIQE